jgi:hypothetical protein
MRIAVFGNSHLAALKKAWDEEGESAHGGMTLTFFGSHRDELKLIRAAGDGLLTVDDEAVRKTLSMTSQLDTSEIRLAPFDCIFLYALVRRNWAVRIGAALLQYRKSVGMVSSGLLQAMMMDQFRDSVLFHMLGVLRVAAKAPIIVAPQPYLSREAFGSEPWSKDAPGLDSQEWQFVVDLCKSYEQLLRQEVSGRGALYLPQPEQTIVDRCFTRPDYSHGSVRLSAGLDIAHGSKDFDHMNSAYGALVLRDLRSTVREHVPALARSCGA